MSVISATICFAHSLAGFDHQFGEKGGIFFALHERAGSGLHVEHERVDAFRQFLAHDGRANQIRTLHRAGHIAQRVKLAIGGSDLCGLPNHGAAADFEHAAKFCHGKIHVEAGDGFQLVERAAGVSQTAPADHRNSDASRGGQRSQHQRSFVADAAGGMLVDFLGRQRGKIEHVARMQHRIRQRRGLWPRHAVQHHRHQPRRHLIVGNIAVRVGVHQAFDLGPRQLDAIPLFADHIDGAERLRHGGRSAHWRRNPSGRSSVMCACFGPVAPWKKMVASGPNS